MLDNNIVVFVVHMASVQSKMTIYPACKAQIALLIAKIINVSAKYTDFASMFLKKLANVLPEKTSIIEYAIELIKVK